jgi:4-hydroxy-tetrahydrodipicolinate synthase
LANVFLPWHVELASLAAAGDWPGAARVQGRIAGAFTLYQYALPKGSFSAAVVGSLKEALVQQGVIAHATTAYPFVQVDDGMREHVKAVLAG